jgi:hypothetical protein
MYLTVAVRDRRMNDAVGNTADMWNAFDVRYVRRTYRMSVRGAGPVHLVPARIVGVMSPAVTARKAEECHGGHAGGSENHAEDVEVHLYGR